MTSVSSNLRDFIAEWGGLHKINLLTRYPSIPTYHALDNRGKLLEEVLVDFDDGEYPLFAREKVDGTNSRIIFFGGSQDYLIGNRKTLLYAKGDIIETDSDRILATIKKYAESMGTIRVGQGFLYVVYGEVYGKSIGKRAKNYSTTTNYFEPFDICIIKLSDVVDIEEDAELSNKRYLYQNYKEYYDGGIEDVKGSLEAFPWTAPAIYDPLPTGLQDTLDFLRVQMPVSGVERDEGSGGRPEGIVIRNFDRSVIAKIRYEDYEKALGIKR